MSLVVVAGMLLILCTGGNNDDKANELNNNTRKTVNGAELIPIQLDKKCKATVEEFNGEHSSQQIFGNLVVVGNEPFTRLSFVEKPKDEDGETVTYRIAKECSETLWEYQVVDIMIEGKVKTDYLETITGAKIKIMTLYPSEVYRIEENPTNE